MRRIVILMACHLAFFACEEDDFDGGENASTSITDSGQAKFIGQLVDAPNCIETDICGIEAVADAKICTRTLDGQTCATTDTNGAFAILGEDHEPLQVPATSLENTQRFLLISSQTDSWGSDLTVNEMVLSEDRLVFIFDRELLKNEIDLSDVRVIGQPEGDQTQEVELSGKISIGEAHDSLHIDIRRLPLSGETWTVYASLNTPCDECDNEQIELGRVIVVENEDVSIPSDWLDSATDTSQVLVMPSATPLAWPAGEWQWAIIDAYYRGGTYLGQAISGFLPTPDGIGVFVLFQYGGIYWTQATGAHVVYGAIFQKWASTGYELGPLGYPTTDESDAVNGGRFNHFQWGSIYWKWELGAWEVHGAIHQKWASLGYERGFLGYPISDERVAPDLIGRYSKFEGGSIYWSPSTDAHEVHGAIFNKWASLGWEQGPLGYPTSDEYEYYGYRVSNFQRGQMWWRTSGPSLSFYQQNMAMLEPGLYNGVDRDESYAALKTHLKNERPDVVGLSEMFYGEDTVLNDSTLKSIYPYRKKGPDDDYDLWGDGGLVLLSKHPFIETDSIVYRVCSSEDCFKNKGILYAQIDVGGGIAYDVFLSHTQNPEPLTTSAYDTVEDQIGLLYSFVEAKRGTRLIPAIVMGDLNTDGTNSGRYNTFMSQMNWPIDAWKAVGNGGPGITSEEKFTDFDITGIFGGAMDNELRETDPLKHPRGESGERLDYALIYQGSRMQADLQSIKIENLQTSSRYDMSDHYGLTVFLNPTATTLTSYWGNLSSVRVQLRRFHTFEVTDGTAPVGTDDEVEWEVSVSLNGGSSVSTRSNKINGINENTNYWWGTPPTVWAHGSVTNATFSVKGEEVDDVCIPVFGCAETGRASLGKKSLTMTKNELIEALWGAERYGLGMMRGDDGEYMATVDVTAWPGTNGF
ncbi:MAG: hypothetical protein GY847_29880 [Proteobacteria bacterium]|nr:hypothetical protein [Pseudomonadota bacterium]